MPTQVLVARLADVLGDRPVPAGVRVQEELTDAWLATYARSRPLPADRTVVERILTSHPPRAFAAMVDKTTAMAIGRGHISGPWLGVAAVWVDPDQRRAGRATAIMTALGHWAAGRPHPYIQVDRENRAAAAAYERLGFRVHHGYLYRPPAERGRETRPSRPIRMTWSVGA